MVLSWHNVEMLVHIEGRLYVSVLRPYGDNDWILASRIDANTELIDTGYSP